MNVIADDIAGATLPFAMRAIALSPKQLQQLNQAVEQIMRDCGGGEAPDHVFDCPEMTFSRLRRKLLPPPDALLECQSAGTKGLFRGGSLSANKQNELEALNAMVLQWDAFLWLEDAISEVCFCAMSAALAEAHVSHSNAAR